MGRHALAEHASTSQIGDMRREIITLQQNLGCDVNSAGNEAGPVPITEPGRGPVLYFSSTRAGGFSPEPEGATTGDGDLYSSEWKGGHFPHGLRYSLTMSRRRTIRSSKARRPCKY